MATNINYLRRGRLAVSGYFVYSYASDIYDDPSAGNIAKETGVLAIQLGSIWYGELIAMRALGWTATRLLTAPITWYVAGVVAAGGAISYAIFGKKGLDDYADFMDDVVTLDFDDLGDKLLFTVETLGSEAKSAASEFIDDALFVTRHFLRETQSYQEEIIQEKVDRHLKFWNPNPSLPV
jgi:hypothetical protein